MRVWCENNKVHQEGVYEQVDGDYDMIVSLHFILQSDLWHVVQTTENKNLFSILLPESVVYRYKWAPAF